MIKPANYQTVDCLPTHSQSSVSNTQAAGIGRIEAIGNLLVINNLGRNIEISRFNDNQLEPDGLFAQTDFPQEDDASQFDLDMHAFLLSPDDSHLLALNHYGLIRSFAYRNSPYSAQPGTTQLVPVQEFLWPGDVERMICIGDCLLSTSPSGYSVPDPAVPGLLISQPWKDIKRSNCQNRHQIQYHVELADWGIITAVATSHSARLLAVAAGNRLGLFSLLQEPAGQVKLDSQLWQITMPFHCAFAQFATDSTLVIAGYKSDHQIDNLSWDEISPGALELIDVKTGQQIIHIDQQQAAIAWGNGAVPLCYLSSLQKLIAVDRQAGVHCWNVRTGRYSQLKDPHSELSLGLGHATICDQRLFWGYNRGGYRLNHIDLSASPF